MANLKINNLVALKDMTPPPGGEGHLDYSNGGAYVKLFYFLIAKSNPCSDFLEVRLLSPASACNSKTTRNLFKRI